MGPFQYVLVKAKVNNTIMQLRYHKKEALVIFSSLFCGWLDPTLTLNTLLRKTFLSIRDNMEAKEERYKICKEKVLLVCIHIGLVNNMVNIDHSFFTQLSVHKYLGCFHILNSVYRAAVNMSAGIFSAFCFWDLWCILQGIVLLGQIEA